MNTSPLLRTLLTCAAGVAFATTAAAQGGVTTSPTTVPYATQPQPAAGPGISSDTQGAGSDTGVSGNPDTGRMGAGSSPSGETSGAGASDPGTYGNTPSNAPGAAGADTGAGNMGAGGTNPDTSASGSEGAASAGGRRMRADRN